MTVPTSGQYSGLYVYPANSFATLGTAVDSLLTSIDMELGTPLLTNLVFFGQPVASDATVTFSGDALSFDDGSGAATMLTDGSDGNPDIIQQGSSAFEFSSGGSDYIVTNGPLTGAVSLDDALSALAAAVPAVGLDVFLLDEALTDAGLGGLLVLPSGEFGNGIYQPPCFAAGTMILTPDGEQPVESLREGGLVALATGIDAEIRWIGSRRITGGSDRPVRVRAGALERNVPTRDLVVSPDHALFIDGVLVPAGLLVNNETIRREPDGAPVTYFHVELDAHGVLLAEGAPAESYLDTGNRRQFANCSLRYDPIDAAHSDPCAEVLFGGPRLDAIRSRLRVFA